MCCDSPSFLVISWHFPPDKEHRKREHFTECMLLYYILVVPPVPPMLWNSINFFIFFLQAWADDVRRFQKMFKYPVSTELVVIVGNHDIGFHYE